MRDISQLHRYDVCSLLKTLGEDPGREGLKETPRRFLSALETMTKGYRMSPEFVLKLFEDGAPNEPTDEMVVQTDIPVYSLCEHHVLPFFGVAHVGYIPNRKLVGLSKLARVLEVFARRLQVQERLTRQLADCLNDALDAKGVGVVLECRHMCMEARGIEKAGTVTRTSALRGVFKASPEARAEFLDLAKRGRAL